MGTLSYVQRCRSVTQMAYRETPHTRREANIHCTVLTTPEVKRALKFEVCLLNSKFRKCLLELYFDMLLTVRPEQFFVITFYST